MGSFQVAWSNVIPFDRLVVGPAKEAALDTFVLALEPPFAPLEGIPARLYIARRTPTEERAKASKTRGLKRPDLEVGFFFIEIRGFDYCDRMGFRLREHIAIDCNRKPSSERTYQAPRIRRGGFRQGYFGAMHVSRFSATMAARMSRRLHGSALALDHPTDALYSVSLRFCQASKFR
jgi:hypothetical protein